MLSSVLFELLSVANFEQALKVDSSRLPVCDSCGDFVDRMERCSCDYGE